MRILHVVHGYAPSIGGSQWLVQKLSEHLVATYNDDVTVFTTTADDLTLFFNRKIASLPAGIEKQNGVTIRRFPVFNYGNRLRMIIAGIAYRLRLPYNDWARTLYNGPIIWSMTRAIAKSRADVVFATAFPLMHMYYALAGAKRAGIPLIFLGALHTEDVWGFNRTMMYRAIQSADAYIAHTPYERNHLVERGISSDKIHVIGSAGVDLAQFTMADGLSIRQRYGWGEKPLILSLGRFVARKRFELLIEAMQTVWVQRPDAQLVIAGGKTVYAEEIERLVTNLPPAQQTNVTLLYNISEEEKPSVLAATTLLVSCSTQESFGITLIEAWACSRPVIGARAGAIATMIRNEIDGLLFEPNDPKDLAEVIQQLISDPVMAKRLGATGKQKVMAHYTWPFVTEQIRSLYASLVHK
ncbi:glycosyltransferase family 4 protein [Chloroflexi bacterium TSY]|nr:glycosyltransferase family 4 protein [Chloroflexi bacterium TSY]